MSAFASTRRRMIAGAIALGGLLSASASGGLRAAIANRPLLPQGDGWRWGVSYGAMPDPATAAAMRLLVVEPDHGYPLAPLRRGGALVLAYLSLGEIERSRPYAAEARAAGLLSQPNPHWPDANYVDLRDRRWHRLVIERIIPPLLARGFDGIFFDTLDNAEAMETADRAGSAGMVVGAATLVRAIRAAFPDALLMMNRGYALLPQAAGDIDLLLAEAMASRWNFAAKRYEMLSASDWQWQADRMYAARAANPALKLLTLDYWQPEDRATVAALYARARAAGFSPYVSTLALDTLLPEPR